MTAAEEIELAIEEKVNGKYGKGLMEKILAMEKKYDKQFKAVFQAIYQLMKEEEKPKHQIGFKTKDDK